MCIANYTTTGMILPYLTTFDVWTENDTVLVPARGAISASAVVLRGAEAGVRTCASAASEPAGRE